MLALESMGSSELVLSTSPQKLTMPVDFTSYLLSSSPPGFELAYQFRLDGPIGGPRGRRSPPTAFAPIISGPGNRDCLDDRNIITNVKDDALDLDEVSQDIASLLVEEFQSAKSQSFPLPGKNHLTHTFQYLNKNNCAKGKDGLKKKSVSFADDIGKKLCHIRLISESSDTPPVLGQNILDSVTKGASPTVTTTPPLVLNFTQPASDYVAFRRKLEKQCVSLENVILKDYRLLGTIKVKNIAFEKSVRIRCTTDSWETICDVPASYVDSAQSSSSQFDTFSFEFEVPPKFDVKKKVQFAVCYETDGRQFWDNNDGDNYEVTCANFKTEKEEREKKTNENPVFSLHNYDDKWTEFSSWSTVDNSIPYW